MSLSRRHERGPTSRAPVTGAHGKVGRVLTRRLAEVGTRCVRATTRPVWDRVDPGEPQNYWQADLTDAGSAYALARDCDVCCDTAAIPADPQPATRGVRGGKYQYVQHPRRPRSRVQSFVNFSSETVPGFIFAHRAFKSDHLPVDEEHPAPAAGPVRDGGSGSVENLLRNQPLRRRVRVLWPHRSSSSTGNIVRA